MDVLDGAAFTNQQTFQLKQWKVAKVVNNQCIKWKCPQGIKEHIDSLEHLSNEQKSSLPKVLLKFPKLFDGKLKAFKPREISLDLKPNAEPHAVPRACPVPRTHLEAFKKKLEELLEQDVLEEAGRSEWISGSFIVPESDAQARWVSDFRVLN